jgi:hypothetical protein
MLEMKQVNNFIIQSSAKREDLILKLLELLISLESCVFTSIVEI